MKNAERKCKTQEDACRLAEIRAEQECKRKNIKIICTNEKECGDNGQDHSENPEVTHYTGEAQVIFNRNYDRISDLSGLDR